MHRVVERRRSTYMHEHWLRVGATLYTLLVLKELDIPDTWFQIFRDYGVQVYPASWMLACCFVIGGCMVIIVSIHKNRTRLPRMPIECCMEV